MKDCTKLFCDLISFGSQLDKSNAPIEQVMSCLAGIYLNENLAKAEIIIDYDAIRSHIETIKSRLAGSDYDIDVPTRLAQGKPVSIRDIVEFHGKHTVKFSDGSSLSYDGGITRY